MNQTNNNKYIKTKSQTNLEKFGFTNTKKAVNNDTKNLKSKVFNKKKNIEIDLENNNLDIFGFTLE